MRTWKFALGYMPHRLWGNIIQAQILRKEGDNEFLTPQEFVQNDPSTEAYGKLTPMQKEVVSLIDSYSERELFRLFSKKPTVKVFLDTVDKQVIRDHIRPYIEKKLFRILEIARDNRLEIFVKEKGIRNIFPEDFLRIKHSPARAVFSFSYGEGLSYSLRVYQDGEPLDLLDTHVEIVSNSPAVIISRNRLCFVKDIEARKLTPFFNRSHISIPSEMEKKYFSSFVKNTLQEYEVETRGFKVDHIKPEKYAELVLELGLNQRPVFILSLFYNGRKVFR